MSPSEKYDQYLERLVLDAQRLDADFRNYTRLWELIDDYIEEINEAPGTFNSFINALRTSTVVLTYRLFDKSSVGLPKLIDQAEKHARSIQWEGNKPEPDDLNDQRYQIALLKGVLDRLRIQRNKAYAHLDQKHVLNREAFANDYPLVSADLKQSIGLAQDLLQAHYGWRHNTHLEMRIVGAVNINHMLELLRVGKKYRLQDYRERRGRKPGAA